MIAKYCTLTGDQYRSSRRKCSVEKVLLGISQNSQENTYARFSILSPKAATLLK